MTAAEWTNYIIRATEAVGTYKPQFDKVIETLASTLEKRDQLEAEYQADPVAVISYPNGTVGKNPRLLLWDELNKSALAYWRDLGLTPAGLKKINEQALTVKRSLLGEVLKELG